MKGCKDCGRTVNPRIEPVTDINEHPAQGVQCRQHGLTFQIVADLGADRGSTQHFELSLKSLIQSADNCTSAGACIFLFRTLELNQNIVAPSKFLWLAVRCSIFTKQLPDFFN